MIKELIIYLYINYFLKFFKPTLLGYLLTILLFYRKKKKRKKEKELGPHAIYSN